ncbi:glycosyltransferase [Nostoc sp.]|uniref:glycosyltransferase n=1 Tax=Nostoc sp. TaxID=1180 RepID=UPI002FFCD964
MLLVSFCIPTYNSQEFIGECLYSVLNQDYENIEIIISDNNSTDNTRSICEKLLREHTRKLKYKIIKNEHNIGPVLNWLNSIEEAKGEYIKLLFSDDLVLPNFTTTAVKFLNDRETGFVYTAAFSGVEIKQSALMYVDKNIAGKIPFLFFVHKALFGEKPWHPLAVPCSPTCALFRKEDLLNVIRELIYLSESKILPINNVLLHGAGLDLLIYLKIADKYNYVVHIPDPLVLCRVRKHSLSSLESSKSIQNFSDFYLSARKFYFERFCLDRYYQEEIINNIAIDIQIEMNSFYSSYYADLNTNLLVDSNISKKGLNRETVNIIKIALDIAVLGLGHISNLVRTGVFRVTENLVKGLIVNSQCEIYFCTSITNLVIPCIDYLNSNFPSHNFKVYTIPELRNIVLDAYHSTFYPLPKDIYHVQRIITIYDLIPILFPNFTPFSDDIRMNETVDSIEMSDIITCISEATKKDLIYNKSFLNDELVFVSHLAADPKNFYSCNDQEKINNVLEKYKIPKQPYLLSICTLEPRKNLEHIIRCFLKLIKERNIDDINLVLVGVRGWKYEKIFAEIEQDQRLAQRVIITGFVKDEDLAALYSGALAFLYVSLYEGFGLPPLEAMQCGTPVITSNTSSLPEVIGDAGIMLDPHDETGLCDAIFKLYSDPEYRENLAKKSFQQAQKFSWDKYLEETIKIYELAKEKSQKLPPRDIIIDGVFFQLYQTGIARVWKSLLEQWANTEFANHILVLDRANTAPKINGVRYRTISPYDYNNTEIDRQILQQICDEEGAELFISSYYTTPITTPSVFMAYDMIPEVLGSNLNEPMWREKHNGIKHASAFIAISENTAKDLSTFFPDIPLESITVAHCGVDSLFCPASEVEINAFKYKYGINKPYFLLSGLGGYKNTILFFQAFAQLSNKHNFDIVATGADSQLPSEWRQYTAGCTFHRLQLSDEELRLAYAGAVALVYPSQYEGFGMPVIEAMACGCAVITTPNASLPEAGGDAVIYVKDDDTEGMVDALCEVQKPSCRNLLINAGLEQAKDFSWVKMAGIVKIAFIKASFLDLNLKETNIIVFPDWSTEEEKLGLELMDVIQLITSHPNHEQITLLIDINGIAQEEADLFLQGIAMNLMMEEEIDITEKLTISLLRDLTDSQWQSLIPCINARLVLEHENKQIVANQQVGQIPLFSLENL